MRAIAAAGGRPEGRRARGAASCRGQDKELDINPAICYNRFAGPCCMQAGGIAEQGGKDDEVSVLRLSAEQGSGFPPF